MEVLRPDWHQALILICEKCGKRMDKPELAHDIKTRMKKEIKERGLQEHARAIVSGCLDICPDDKMVIAIVGDRPGSESLCYLAEPGSMDDEKKILDLLEKRAAP